MITSRRGALRLGAVSVSAALGFVGGGSQTAMAAEGWSVDPIAVSNASGEVSTLEIGSGDLTVDFSWKGIDDTTTSVTFGLDVRLNDGEYKRVASGEIELDEGSGGGRVGDDVEWATDPAYPIDLIGDGGLDASAISAPDGERVEHTLGFRLSFNHDEARAESTTSTTLTVSDTQAVIDDFESGNLDAWYGDGKSSFNATTTRPYDGSYSLDYTASGTWSRGIISHPDENTTLDNYPSRGDTIRGRMYYGHHDNRCRFVFGLSDYSTSAKVQPWNDGYYLRISASNNRMSIRYAGSETTIGSTDVPIPANDWFTVIVEFDIEGDGTITAKIEDSDGNVVGSVSVNDTKYSGRGVGLQFNVNNSSDNKFWTDDWKVV